MQTKAEASTQAPHDGEFALRLPGVYAIEVSRPTTAMARGLQHPAACIIAGGAPTKDVQRLRQQGVAAAVTGS